MVEGRSLATPAFVLLALAVPVSTAGAAIAAGLVLFLWVFERARGRARGGARIPLLAPALLLWVGGQAVSALVHGTPRSLEGVVERSWMALLVFAAGDLLVPFAARGRAVALAFLFSLSVSGAYAVAQHFLGIDYLRHLPLEPAGATYVATGFFDHHLTLGGVLAVGLSLAAGIFLTARSGGLYLAATAVGAAAGLGLLASSARSAWIGAAAGLFGAAPREGKRALATVVLAVVVVGGIALALQPDLRDRAARAFEGNRGLTPPRMLLVRTSLRMYAAHPLLGVGPGNFRKQFPEYRVPGVYESTAHPHNDLLRALLDGGPLAAIGYLGVLAATLAFLVKRAARTRDPLAKGVVLGALGASLFLLVGGVFQTYFADVEVTSAFFLLLGLAVAAGREEPSRTPAPAPSAR